MTLEIQVEQNGGGVKTINELSTIPSW